MIDPLKAFNLLISLKNYVASLRDFYNIYENQTTKLSLILKIILKTKIMKDKLKVYNIILCVIITIIIFKCFSSVTSIQFKHSLGYLLC